MPVYTDKTLTCVECHNDFVHSAGAQEFFAEKGFTAEPKRCPDCRKLKKERAGPGGGGDKKGKNDRGPQKGAGESRQMYATTCDDCGKATEVPFKPSGGKPVYCKPCYESNKPARR